MRSRWRALICGTGLAAFAATSLSASSDTLSSSWRQQAVTIDGKNDEWQQGLTRLAETPASVGVMNDGHDLYVAIAVSDQAQRRRLMMAGLNVWIDKDGGKKKRFGINIPGLGFSRGNGGGRPDSSSMPPPSGDPGAPPPDDPQSGGGGGQPPGAGQADRRELPSLLYFSILGPDEKDKRRVERDEAKEKGLDAERGLTEGILIYEIKIPLAAADAQALGIGATPGQKISIGLETPKFERPGGGEGGGMGRGGRGGGGGGGGMGGGMGGRGGGMGRGGMGGGGGMGGRGGGGRGGPGGGEEVKPLNVWATIQLAKAV